MFPYRFWGYSWVLVEKKLTIVIHFGLEWKWSMIIQWDLKSGHVWILNGQKEFGLDFEMRKPNFLKLQPMATILSKTIWNPDKIPDFLMVQFSIAWPFKTRPSEILSSISVDFEWSDFKSSLYRTEIHQAPHLSLLVDFYWKRVDKNIKQGNIVWAGLVNLIPAFLAHYQIWVYFTFSEAYFDTAYSYFQILCIYIGRI